MGKIYKNDTLTEFRFNVGVDISDATKLEVCLKKPDGSTGTWTDGEIWDGTWLDKHGEIDPKYNENWFRHITTDGDLNVGDDQTAWEFQVYIESPTLGKKHGHVALEIIYDTIC